MRDDVVELAGDPLALLGDRTVGGRELLGLESERAGRQLSRLRRLPADDEPGRPRDRDERSHPDVVDGRLGEADVRPQPDRLHEHEARDRARSCVVRAQAPGKEEHDDEERRVGVPHLGGLEQQRRRDRQRRDDRPRQGVVAREQEPESADEAEQHEPRGVVRVDRRELDDEEEGERDSHDEVREASAVGAPELAKPLHATTVILRAGASSSARTSCEIVLEDDASSAPRPRTSCCGGVRMRP